MPSAYCSNGWSAAESCGRLRKVAESSDRCTLISPARITSPRTSRRSTAAYPRRNFARSVQNTACRASPSWGRSSTVRPIFNKHWKPHGNALRSARLSHPRLDCEASTARLAPRHARPLWHPRIQGVGSDEVSLLQSEGELYTLLRRARHHGLRTLARVILRLSSGHGQAPLAKA